MRKRLAVAAMACVLVSFGLGTAAMAGAASTGATPGTAAGAHTRSGVVPNGLVTPSSQWTLYDLAFEGSAYTMGWGPCEVLSFENHGTFTGDKGSVGRWKGNIKLTFTNNTFLPKGTYAAKYASDLTAFQGDDQTGRAWGGVGPLRLYKGDDPEGVGTC
jgi:hypothetical protein